MSAEFQIFFKMLPGTNLIFSSPFLLPAPLAEKQQGNTRKWSSAAVMFSFAQCLSFWTVPWPPCPSLVVLLAFQEQAGDLGLLSARLLVLPAKFSSAGYLQKRNLKKKCAKSSSSELGTVYTSCSIQVSNKLSPWKAVSPLLNMSSKHPFS